MQVKCQEAADACVRTAKVCSFMKLFLQLRFLTHPALPCSLQPNVEAVGHLSKSVGKVAMQKLIFMGPQQQ